MVRELAGAYGYDSLRFYILSFHYRSPINFAPEHVAAAKSAVTRLRNCISALREAEPGGGSAEVYKQRFLAALEDDFNTADAIGVMFELVKHANTVKDSGLLPALTEMCDVLGLDIGPREAGDAQISEAEIQTILDERAEARKNKEWKRSDELRDGLKARGVIVKDTTDGQKWHYGTD
jgi:cysteinyl-tRNA synthetase